MLLKIVVTLACAGAVIAPAIAETYAKIDAGGMVLTAAQMDGISAGGFADEFVSASVETTGDRILVEVSGQGDKKSESAASATLNFTYSPQLPDGTFPDPERESSYDGEVKTDSKIASVTSQVEGVEPIVPVVDTPAEEVITYTASELLAQGNSISSIISFLRNR